MEEKLYPVTLILLLRRFSDGSSLAINIEDNNSSASRIKYLNNIYKMNKENRYPRRYPRIWYLNINRNF